MWIGTSNNFFTRSPVLLSRATEGRPSATGSAPTSVLPFRRRHRVQPGKAWSVLAAAGIPHPSRGRIWRGPAPPLWGTTRPGTEWHGQVLPWRRWRILATWWTMGRRCTPDMMDGGVDAFGGGCGVPAGRGAGEGCSG
jgi:hypothetical protein